MAKLYTTLPKKPELLLAKNNEPQPRPHVLRNLLNYSRSLEVAKNADGKIRSWVLN